MTFEERMTQIKSELIGMLTTYVAPKHLQDNDKAMRDEIEMTARMINNKFPSDTTHDHIRGTMERATIKLKEAHTSRTWPTGKDIGTAVSKSLTTSKSSLPTNRGPWKPDTLKINAARIKAGEPVGETYIQGKMAERMLKLGLVTEDDLAPYLVYLDHHKRLTQEC